MTQKANQPAATNPAITSGSHAKSQWRRFVDRNRSPSFMRVTFHLSIVIGCLLLCACSKHDTATRPAARNMSSQAEFVRFSDGTTVQARERSGDELSGVHMVRKSPEGEESYVAERGKISEEPGGIVRVILYDAQVDRGPRGRMTAKELSIRLMR